MNIPLQSSIAEAVCLVLMRNDSKTRTEICHILNQTSRTGIDRAVKLLTDSGALVQVGRRYALCEEMRQHYANYQPPVVVSTFSTGFKPWSGKYSLANALLREPIRTDFSPMNASVAFRPLGGA